MTGTVTGRAVISGSQQVLDADGTIASASATSDNFQERQSVPALDAALTDIAFAKALRLFADGDRDWRLLYVILEIVVDDVGGKRAVAAAAPSHDSGTNLGQFSTFSAPKK